MDSNRRDQIPSCKIIKSLERHTTILRAETRYILRINYQLEDRQERFDRISRNLSDKLNSLWSLSSSHGSQPISKEVQMFAHKISLSWSLMSKQVVQKYCKIRMASRTFPGVPLSVLVENLKKQIALMKASHLKDVTSFNRKDESKMYALFKTIQRLLENLESCDKKLQQYFAVTKMAPYLLTLDSEIEKYVDHVDLSAMKILSNSVDSNVFPFLFKLLTGELLNDETIDPHCVLAENTPKKPVFIFKNIKRKFDTQSH